MYKIQLRRDKARNWTEKDPVLDQGEPGFEVDTGRFKMGDGVTPWSLLGYFTPSHKPVKQKVVEDAIQRHIDHPLPHPAYDDMPSLKLLFENGLL